MQNDRQTLDLIDRRLIYEFDRDSRQPITKIARKLRISSQTAEYRTGQLQKRGVIKAFPTIVDYKKLGYTWFSLLIRTRPIPTKEKERILKKILESPRTITFFEGDGRWNFYYGTIAEDVAVADESISEVSEILKGYIVESQLLVHIAAYHYGRRYLYEEEGVVEPQRIPAEGPQIVTPVTYGGMSSRVKIDETDLNIVKWLSWNSRASTMEIAKNIRSTPDVVRYRIKNLVKSGIVKRFSVLLQPEKYGHYWVRVFVKLLVNTRANRDAIRKFLHKYPSTFRVITTMGGYDMIIDLLITQEEMIRSFLADLTDNFAGSVIAHETMRMGELWKGFYFFTPP